MDDVTRRDALALAGFASASALLAAPAFAGAEDAKPKPAMTEADRALDRQRILAAGFTEAEADCWEALNRCAEKFFALPKLHVMDDHEIAHAVHVLQYRLLGRPGYRRYLEVARAKKQ